ncbi:MAG: 1-acyl-sn-glycerol-3-phosphate acyltransferase [Candidatus Eisenbacteria bacterium]|nr:1-acyl-sn-glycerol-3-phosphate acyltransferase [Candidatus Eisenbacteria bacterium]
MRPHYRIGWLALRTLVWLVWGVRGRGADRMPASGPVLVACNHISNWDPVLVGLACRRELHFLAKDGLFRNRVFGRLIRAYNALPVRRGGLDRRALSLAIGILRRGDALLVFPEGTRSRSGEVGEARHGAAYMASAGGAVVVPAAVAGSNELGRAFLRRRRVRVAFGGAIEAGAGSRAEYEALTNRIMAAIGELRRELQEP